MFESQPLRWLFINAFRPLQFFYQRLTRGFDDSACWDLDSHIAELILPRLKRFKEVNQHAWPGPIPDMPRDTDVATFEEWHQIIDKMIDAFDYFCNEVRKYERFDEAEYETALEGLRLFAKYYPCLWD